MNYIAMRPGYPSLSGGTRRKVLQTRVQVSDCTLPLGRNDPKVIPAFFYLFFVSEE